VGRHPGQRRGQEAQKPRAPNGGAKPGRQGEGTLVRDDAAKLRAKTSADLERTNASRRARASMPSPRSEMMSRTYVHWPFEPR
jgi:hypothetical protein